MRSRREPFLIPVSPTSVSRHGSVTLSLQLWASHLSWSCQVSAVLSAVALPSVLLLNRLALRPVTGFPQSPWMVVTPSTTMASADFCPPERGRSPRIRYDIFPLTLAAFTWSRFDPFGTSLSVASSSGAPRLLTQFLSSQSRFCSPAASPRRFALYAVAFG